LPKPKANHTPLSAKLKKYSPDLAKFILDCLLIDPKKRLISSELLQHSYFNNKSWLEDYLVKLKGLVASHEASIAKLNLNKITTSNSNNTQNESVKSTPAPVPPPPLHTSTRTNHYSNNETKLNDSINESSNNNNKSTKLNIINNIHSNNVSIHLPSVPVSPLNSNNKENVNNLTNNSLNNTVNTATTHHSNLNNTTMEIENILYDLKNQASTTSNTPSNINNYNIANLNNSNNASLTNSNSVNKLNLTFGASNGVNSNMQPYHSDSKASFTSNVQQNHHETTTNKKQPQSKLVSLPQLLKIQNFNAKKASKNESLTLKENFSPNNTSKFSDLNSPLSNWTRKAGIKVRVILFLLVS
jgi:hypothetical protein